MIKQQRKKLVLFLLILIAVLIIIFCYQNRFTQTEEAYTFTRYIYKNDELDEKITKIKNEYDDTLVSTYQFFYPEGVSISDSNYYYYKYDKDGNKKLCIMKNQKGDTESKEVFKYDRKGNCIFEKSEDDESYLICYTDYNDKKMMTRKETEMHDLKYDSHNICEYYYDDNDRLIKEISTESDNCFYEYDENGLLKTLKKKSKYGWSSEEKYDYNENSLLLRTVHYSPDNTIFSEIKYEYNDESELISETKVIYRDNGEIDVYETHYTYDSNGRKTSETNISNDIKAKYIHYEYDDNSNLVKQSEYEYYE